MTDYTILSGILLGGGATMLAVQILKSKLIPISFENHKRATAAVVSLIASVITEEQAGVTINIHNLPSLGVLFVGTLWIAVSVYNHLYNN